MWQFREQKMREQVRQREAAAQLSAERERQRERRLAGAQLDETQRLLAAPNNRIQRGLGCGDHRIHLLVLVDVGQLTFAVEHAQNAQQRWYPGLVERERHVAPAGGVFDALRRPVLRHLLLEAVSYTHLRAHET